MTAVRVAAAADQKTPETIKAGVALFPHFLAHCDGLIAFASPSYFSRLWCVYELAIFCRERASELDTKLLLLSLDWPATLDPRKTATLSAKERAMFATFSCVNACCYLPRDRAFVLAAIRDKWGSEEAFDAFVREELPPLFERSKARYQRRVGEVFSRALEMLFGT